MEIFSIGYERRSIDKFCETLASVGVDVLLDVRQSAWSMRPEYRKNALAAALRAHGIRYVHMKEAGNPFRPRPGDALDFDTCAQMYGEYIADRPHVLKSITNLANHERVAVFCYEGHRSRCHRGVLLERMADEIPSTQVVDL